MGRALQRFFYAALVWHPRECQLALRRVEMALNSSNGGTHGVNQWIGVSVVPTLVQHLVKQFQRGQKDPQAAPCADGDRYVFPAIPMWMDFALQFLDQVIFYRLPYSCWRIVPVEADANLPDVCLQVREEWENRVQIDLNSLLAHTHTGLFAKERQRNMQTIRAVKHEKRVLMLAVFGTWSKPIRRSHYHTRHLSTHILYLLPVCS